MRQLIFILIFFLLSCNNEKIENNSLIKLFINNNVNDDILINIKKLKFQGSSSNTTNEFNIKEIVKGDTSIQYFYEINNKKENIIYGRLLISNFDEIKTNEFLKKIESFNSDSVSFIKKTTLEFKMNNKYSFRYYNYKNTFYIEFTPVNNTVIIK